jgi:glutathione S-transferase
MKLIIATPSPYARKVRVIMREKNINFEEIIDVPWNTDTLTLGINPLGKIPILLRDGHEPLFDSKVIVQFLDKYKQKPLFYPKDPDENISARLVETVAEGICDSIVLLFLENSRNETLRSKTWIKRQEKKIIEGVKYLSNNLQEKKYFVGNFFNIADVSVFTCLEYLDLRFSKFKWRDSYQNLVSYWLIHKNRQSFIETKPVAQVIEPLDN